MQSSNCPKGPIIQNVVSSAKLSLENLKLDMIARKMAGSRFNQNRFPALIVRNHRPKSTFLIFKSGRMIIIGSQSEVQAGQAAKKMGKDLCKLMNQKIEVKEFRITNLVANADLGYCLNIPKIAQDQIAQKDDGFPGAIHHMRKPVKTALLFSSGKIVFTGAQSIGQIQEAYQKLLEILSPYKITNTEF